MISIATPSRRERTFISSRICAWIVTSSAVVGSSARISDGLHASRSEEHTSELQSLAYLVCRLLLEKKKHTAQESTCSHRDPRPRTDGSQMGADREHAEHNIAH